MNDFDRSLLAHPARSAEAQRDLQSGDPGRFEGGIVLLGSLLLPLIHRDVPPDLLGASIARAKAALAAMRPGQGRSVSAGAAVTSPNANLVMNVLVNTVFQTVVNNSVDLALVVVGGGFIAFVLNIQIQQNINVNINVETDSSNQAVEMDLGTAVVPLPDLATVQQELDAVALNVAGTGSALLLDADQAFLLPLRSYVVDAEELVLLASQRLAAG